MVAILNNLSDAEDAVVGVNSELIAAGRADLLDPVETRVFPSPEGQLASYHTILTRTQLKELPGAPGFRDQEYEFFMAFGSSDASRKRQDQKW